MAIANIKGQGDDGLDNELDDGLDDGLSDLIRRHTTRKPDEKKEIEISIGDFSSAAGTTGFFVLPSLAEISAEQAIDAVLVIIIIVLAIALIARIVNRSRKKEFQ